jgi:hypothetical protein
MCGGTGFYGKLTTASSRVARFGSNLSEATLW